MSCTDVPFPMRIREGNKNGSPDLAILFCRVCRKRGGLATCHALRAVSRTDSKAVRCGSIPNRGPRGIGVEPLRQSVRRSARSDKKLDTRIVKTVQRAARRCGTGMGLKAHQRAVYIEERRLDHKSSLMPSACAMGSCRDPHFPAGPVGGNWARRHT